MQENSTGFEDVTVMRDFQREVRVLLNEQNGDAQRLIDLDDLFENRFCKNRGDPEGWFVQH